MSKQKLKSSLKKFLSPESKLFVPAFLGNIAGTVKADNNQNVFVVLSNGEELTVRNSRVPLVLRLPVIIGYDDKNPTLLQVIRARDVYVNSPFPDIPNHADSTHTWPKYDTLWVSEEQFFPGLVIPDAGLIVSLVGFVYYLNGWHCIANQPIDLSSEAMTDGAKYVLVECDEDGVITFNSGATKESREMLLYEDIPLVSSVNKRPLFAVKMYAGQSSVLKSRLYKDIIDLRWSGYASGAGMAGAVNWADIIDVPAVFPPDTTYTDPLYVRKFDSVVDPTVDDDISLGYLKNDLWHNTATRSYFLCHDNADGAADWFALGQGGGDASFVVDGHLAVIASSATNVIVFTKDTTVEDWYFYIEDKGSAGTTILDVHYLVGGSGTIFTTQANRTYIAFDAVSNLMVATPNVTQFLAGDVIELQIDQVATDAMSLVLIGNITGSSGGSGGNAVTVDDGVTQVGVGNIVFVGATVTDDGGGQATVTMPLSAMVLLEQHTASASTSLDFTSFVSADYDEYVFELINLIPSTTNGILQIKMSEDGGANYAAGTSYQYLGWYLGIGDSFTGIGSSGAAAIDLARSTSTQANYSTNGSLKLFNPSGANYKMTISRVTNVVGSGAIYMWDMNGSYISTNAVDAVRFIFSSGNIASGTIRVYGVSK